MSRRASNWNSKIKEYVSSILIALVCFVFIRTSVVEAYRIPSGSMENTLLIGDFLLANKFIYGARIPLIKYRLPAIKDPEPGDIVIFRSPVEESKTLIKRCVAVGGQTVEIRNKSLYIDGKHAPLPSEGKFVDRTVYGNGPRDNYAPIKVPPGHMFVMGDNRDNSFDSRYFGPVSQEAVLGEAMIIYFSWNSTAPLWDFTRKVQWDRLAKLIR